MLSRFPAAFRPPAFASRVKLSAVHDRHDLTDEEWALLEPLLPDRSPRMARPWKYHRQVVYGVLWRTRTGSPWRDLPAGYGCWKTVYNQHRRWSAHATWQSVLTELQRGCVRGEQEWLVAVVSTVVRLISMQPAPDESRRRTCPRRSC